MPIDFFADNCTSKSSQKTFGLCDDLPPATNVAYIDETDGSKWIAVVENERRIEVSFVGVDNCPEIVLSRADGTTESRCDGMLYYENTIIFVELKDRDIYPSKKWLDKAYNQLKSTILVFEQTDEHDDFPIKKAFIANRARPFFSTGQQERIARFNSETNGYVLYIQNRIDI